MSNKLISVTEATKEKGKNNRNSIYFAISQGKLDTKEVGGRKLIIVNKKYQQYK